MRNHLLQDSVFTSCSHQFCRKCMISSFRYTNKVSCPFCKATVTKRNLKGKPQLQEVVSAAEQLVHAVSLDSGREVVSSEMEDLCIKTQDKEKSRVFSPHTDVTNRQKKNRWKEREQPEEEVICVDSDTEDELRQQKSCRRSLNLNVKKRKSDETADHVNNNHPLKQIKENSLRNPVNNRVTTSTPVVSSTLKDLSKLILTPIEYLQEKTKSGNTTSRSFSKQERMQNQKVPEENVTSGFLVESETGTPQKPKKFFKGGWENKNISVNFPLGNESEPNVEEDPYEFISSQKTSKKKQSKKRVVNRRKQRNVIITKQRKETLNSFKENKMFTGSSEYNDQRPNAAEIYIMDEVVLSSCSDQDYVPPKMYKSCVEGGRNDKPYLRSVHRPKTYLGSGDNEAYSNHSEDNQPQGIPLLKNHISYSTKKINKNTSKHELSTGSFSKPTGDSDPSFKDIEVPQKFPRLNCSPDNNKILDSSSKEKSECEKQLYEDKRSSLSRDDKKRESYQQLPVTKSKGLKGLVSCEVPDLMGMKKQKKETCEETVRSIPVSLEDDFEEPYLFCTPACDIKEHLSRDCKTTCTKEYSKESIDLDSAVKQQGGKGRRSKSRRKSQQEKSKIINSNLLSTQEKVIDLVEKIKEAEVYELHLETAKKDIRNVQSQENSELKDNNLRSSGVCLQDMQEINDHHKQTEDAHDDLVAQSDEAQNCDHQVLTKHPIGNSLVYDDKMPDEDNQSGIKNTAAQSFVKNDIQQNSKNIQTSNQIGISPTCNKTFSKLARNRQTLGQHSPKQCALSQIQTSSRQNKNKRSLFQLPSKGCGNQPFSANNSFTKPQNLQSKNPVEVQVLTSTDIVFEGLEEPEKVNETSEYLTTVKEEEQVSLKQASGKPFVDLMVKHCLKSNNSCRSNTMSESMQNVYPKKQHDISEPQFCTKPNKGFISTEIRSLGNEKEIEKSKSNTSGSLAIPDADNFVLCETPVREKTRVQDKDGMEHVNCSLVKDCIVVCQRINIDGIKSINEEKCISNSQVENGLVTKMYDATPMTAQSENVPHLQKDCLDETPVYLCTQVDSSDKTHIPPYPQIDSSNKTCTYPCLQSDYLSKIHTATVSEENYLNGKHTICYPLKDLVNSKKQESLWWKESCINLELSVTDENLQVTVLSIKPQLLNKETHIKGQSSTAPGSETVPCYKQSWKNRFLDLEFKNSRERKFMTPLLPEKLDKARSMMSDCKGKALSQSVDISGNSSEAKFLKRNCEEIDLAKEHSRTTVMNKLIKYPKTAVLDQVKGFTKPVQQSNPLVTERPEESSKIKLPVADVDEKVQHKKIFNVDTVEKGLMLSQSLLVNFEEHEQKSCLVCTKNPGSQGLSQVCKSSSKSFSQEFANEYVPEDSLSVNLESSDKAGQSSSDNEREHLQVKISPLKTDCFDQTSGFNSDSTSSVGELYCDSNSQATKTSYISSNKSNCSKIFFSEKKDVYEVNGHKISQSNSTAVKDIHECILTSQDNKNDKQILPVNGGMEEGGNHVSKHLDECGGANDAMYQSSDDRITGEDVPQIKNYSKLYNNVLGNHSLLSLPKDSQTSLNQIDDDQMYQARNDQMSKNWDCEISGVENNQPSQNQVSDDEGDEPYVLLDHQRTSSTGDSEMIPRAYNHSLNISFDEGSFPICEDIKSLESTNVLSQIQEKTLSIKCLEKLGDKSKNYLYNSSQQNFDHTDVEWNTEISGKNHNSKYLDCTNLYSDTECFEENPIYSEKNINKPLLSFTNPICNEWNDVHSNQTCVSPLEVPECCSYRSPKTMENNVISKNVVDDKEGVKSKVSICPNRVDLNECYDEKQFLHSTLKVKETEKCISHNVFDSKHGDDKSQLSQELVCDDDVFSDADWLFAEELVAPLKALGNILKKSQERHSFEHKDPKLSLSENSKNCLGPRSELHTEGIHNGSKIIFRRKRLFSSSRSNSQMTHGVSPSPRCILRDQDTQQGNNLSYHEETSGNQHVNKNVLHSQKHKHKFTRVKNFQKIRKIFDSSDSEENDHYPSKMMKKHQFLWDQSVEEDCDIFQSLDEPISQELSSCTSKYIHDQKSHLDKYEEEPDLEFNNLDDETCEEPPTDLPSCSGPITILSEESQTSGNEGDNSEAMNRVIANVQADLNCNQTSHSFKNLPEPSASREEPASLSGWSGIIDIQAQNQMKKEIEQMYKKIMILEARLLKPSKNNKEGNKNTEF